MSLQDDGRYLELIAALANDDPGIWVAVDALTAHMAANMSRGDDALRTDKALASLWGASFIVFSADEQRVALTAKGLWTLGKGERPADL